jgi:hypothetical protein
MRLVFPDLEIDEDDPAQATASNWVPIRELDGDGKATWEGELVIDSIEPIPVKTGSPSQLLLQFRADADAVQPERTVALFQLGPDPKLLDVGTISAWPDDFGSLQKSSLVLNANTEVFETLTDHSNSQQGYEGRRYFFVDSGRIKMIYDAELLNGRCIAGENFDENIAISSAPDAGRLYNKVTIRITLDFMPDTDCPDGKRTRKSRRTFSAIFRWDAAKKEFVTTSNQLAELEAFNEKRH